LQYCDVATRQLDLDSSFVSLSTTTYADAYNVDGAVIDGTSMLIVGYSSTSGETCSDVLPYSDIVARLDALRVVATTSIVTLRLTSLQVLTL
jgi:hypothetical protein